MSTTKIKITGTVVAGRETITDGDGETIVLQAGGPVSGATVTVKNTDTNTVLGTTTSGSNGNFSLEVPDGDIALTATKDGTEYATENVNITAVDGDAVIIDSGPP